MKSITVTKLIAELLNPKVYICNLIIVSLIASPWSLTPKSVLVT